MSSSAPKPGSILPCRYLWSAEERKGHDRGRKLRPCLVIASDEKSVTVAAFTHRPQQHKRSVEIPKAYIRAAGLDGNVTYVVTNEVNVFRWPDKRIAMMKAPVGAVPQGFLEQVKKEMVVGEREHGIRRVDHAALERDIIRRYRAQQDQRQG